MSQAVEIQKTKPKKVPLPAKFVVGGVAGIVGTTAIFPIDMVKTRLQILNPQGMKMYSSPLHVVKSLLKHEGIAGFYRGLIPNLIGVTPEKAIKLAVNEILREVLEDKNGNITFKKEVLAGMGAGTCQVIATNPMEIVKIRLQVQSTLPAAEQMSAKQVVSHLGLRGLYRGAAVTMMRDVPFSMMFFPGYANLNAWFEKKLGRQALWASLLSGCLAGAFASGAVTPMDVIKTRLQVKGGAKLYNGFLDCFSKVVANEGPSALFRGLVPRACVQAPLFGIALLAYEMQKRYMFRNEQ